MLWCILHKMTSVSDIKYFFETNSRDDNDKTNRIREECILLLNGSSHPFFEDETFGKQWCHLKSEFKKYCQLLCQKKNLTSCSDIILKKRANRNNNHDFDLTLISEEDFETIHFEFKVSKTIEMPQFVSLYDKDRYISETLAEYWYDKGGLDSMLDLYPTKLSKPSREDYLKEVYKPAGKTTKHPFFKQLYLWDKDAAYGPKTEKYKKKGELVHQHIKMYLDAHHKNFDIDKLKKKILETQKEKMYGIWNTLTHRFEYLEYSKAMLTPTKIDRIKGSDYLMIDTEEPNYQLQCLLRWRNHNGVSLPAWQIKLIKKDG
jgi:hypothetical protein